MSRGKLHHILKTLRRLRTWQLVVLALFFTAAAIALLRQNSIEAIQRFEAVKQADREGKDTKKPLTELQRYVSAHMNTQLERVSLEKTYERDYQAAIAKVATSGSVNDAKYRDSELGCRTELNRTGSFPGYAQCVANQVGQTAPGQNPELTQNLPKPERYQFTFASPDFSFDAAGWTLLVALFFWTIIAMKLLAAIVIRLLLRRRHGIH